MFILSHFSLSLFIKEILTNRWWLFNQWHGGNEYLEKMLPILQKHQVKATFFLEGNWVRNNVQLAKKIAKDGHEIGNHSYNHPDMSKLTTGRISEQLDKTNEQIEQTIGVKPKWFAPPSGSFRKRLSTLQQRNRWEQSCGQLIQSIGKAGSVCTSDESVKQDT